MRLLKRKILLEDDIQNNEVQPMEQAEYAEPTVEELLSQIESGQISPDDVESMFNNGEISEETFNDFSAQVETLLANDADNQESAENMNPEEQMEEDPNANQNPVTADEIVNAVNTGEMTIDDVESMHNSGEIPDDLYNEVSDLIVNMSNSEEGMTEDPNQLADDEMMQPEEPQLEPQLVTNPFNLSHLFEHFLSLKKYINIYIDSFSDIDLDQITDLQYKTVSNVFKDIKDLLEKLKFYINNEFALNTYNKNLYVYLLYNKKFSENIIKLRRILQLNKEVLIDEDKIKKLDKKKKK